MTACFDGERERAGRATARFSFPATRATAFSRDGVDLDTVATTARGGTCADGTGSNSTGRARFFCTGETPITLGASVSTRDGERGFDGATFFVSEGDADVRVNGDRDGRVGAGAVRLAARKEASSRVRISILTLRRSIWPRYRF